MKQVLLVTVVLIAVSNCAQAQTFAEWFSQKKTQKKYLLKQIAELQAHFIQLKKGYDIARGGLKTIHSITSGEMNLHQAFFTSLKTVNPKISRYSRVADIISNQVAIIRLKKEAMRQVTGPGKFVQGDGEMVSDVYAGILHEAAALLDDLVNVITSGNLEMPDDQRIKRIEELYLASQEQKDAAYGLYRDISYIAVQRERELADAGALKQFYEFKK